MPWYAIYRISDGELISTGSVLGSLPSDLASAVVAAPSGVWNKITRVFDPNPVLKGVISIKQFQKALTQAEREALQNILATGTQVQKNKINAFLDYLRADGNVDMNDVYIQNALTLMETVGILSAGRAAALIG